MYAKNYNFVFSGNKHNRLIISELQFLFVYCFG